MQPIQMMSGAPQAMNEASEVLCLLRPEAEGRWYVEVRDAASGRAVDIILDSLRSAEGWMAAVIEGLCLERALAGQALLAIEPVGASLPVATGA